MAVGSLVGFLGVLMAWYGVNFVLGTGLHSYGFGSGGYTWIGAFVLFEMAVIGLAALPAAPRGSRGRCAGADGRVRGLRAIAREDRQPAPRPIVNRRRRGPGSATAVKPPCPHPVSIPTRDSLTKTSVGSPGV